MGTVKVPDSPLPLLMILPVDSVITYSKGEELAIVREPEAGLGNASIDSFLVSSTVELGNRLNIAFAQVEGTTLLEAGG